MINLFTDFLGTPIWMWGAFLGIVLTLLVADLGVFNRKDHEIGVRESLVTSAFYIFVGLAFGFWIRYQLGQQSAEEYWTGFVVEKTLSMDNVFVMSMIFSFFAIPRMYQHRVLFWGILGVIILRGLMIGIGATLVHEFEWILYLFALFLIFTGAKMFLTDDKDMNIADNKILKFLHAYLPVSEKIEGNKFFTRLPEEGASGKLKLFCTPLFIALVTIEFVDLIFAVDSVPAVFSVTSDAFIVYTSNIFAILGLRALYFALDAMIDRFKYLKPALAIVLIFIGSKIFIAWFAGWEKFPTSVSLSVTAGIIFAGMLYSLYKTSVGGPAQVKMKKQ